MFQSKKEVFKFIDSMRDIYSLKVMCDLYGVSRHGYASWKRRGISNREKEDAILIEKIEEVFYKFDGIFGSPKIQIELKKEGVNAGLNRVARLMHENELKARAAIIYRSHAKLDKFYASFKNEIHDLEATGPDQIWVGDVTYLYVNGEPRYLAVVLDKYSRKIIGWSLSKRRNAELTLAAVKHAAKKRVVGAGLYFHSDRGQEYLATKYRKWLKDREIIQSCNRKGVMNDNAEMESFFRQFKTERIHRNEFITERELRGVVIEYVNFYNKTRIHSSLNYMTPEEYEVRMGS